MCLLHTSPNPTRLHTNPLSHFLNFNTSLPPFLNPLLPLPNPQLHTPKTPQIRRPQEKILQTDTHPRASHLLPQKPPAVIALAGWCGDEQDPEEDSGDEGPVGEGDEGDVCVESLGKGWFVSFLFACLGWKGEGGGRRTS